MKNEDKVKMHEEKARQLAQAAEDSFQRCDTDGFITQWVNQSQAQKERMLASLAKDKGVKTFMGLYEGDRRVKARVIDTRYGQCWLLNDEEKELLAKRGKPFIPMGDNSKIQRELELEEKAEKAKAYVDMVGGGRGLSGLGSGSWEYLRDGCQWGSDAVVCDN
jgi:hypothetical protein